MVYYLCASQSVPGSVKRFAREQNEFGRKVWVSPSDSLIYKIFVLKDNRFDIYEHNIKTRNWEEESYSCRRIDSNTFEILSRLEYPELKISEYPELRMLKTDREFLLLRYEDGWDVYHSGEIPRQIEGFFVKKGTYHERFYDPDRFNVDLGRVKDYFVVSLYVHGLENYARVFLNGNREFGDFELAESYVRKVLVKLFETAKNVKTGIEHGLEVKINFQSMSYTITFQNHNSKEETKYTFAISNR